MTSRKAQKARELKRKIGMHAWLRETFGDRMFSRAEIAHLLGFTKHTMESLAALYPLERDADLIQEGSVKIFDLWRLR